MTETGVQRVDTATATQGFWGWLDNRSFKTAFDRAVRLWGKRYNLDLDDLEGEAYVYLGVRGDRIVRAANVWNLVQRCARTMSERRSREPDFDEFDSDVM